MADKGWVKIILKLGGQLILVASIVIMTVTFYDFLQSRNDFEEIYESTRNFNFSETPQQVTRWTRIGDDRDPKYHAVFCQLLPYTRNDGSQEFCYVVEEGGNHVD